MMELKASCRKETCMTELKVTYKKESKEICKMVLCMTEQKHYKKE